MRAATATVATSVDFSVAVLRKGIAGGDDATRRTFGAVSPTVGGIALIQIKERIGIQ